MDRHPSTLKRARQNIKRRARNQAVKSRVKTAVRRVHEAIGGKDPAVIRENARVAISLIDKASQKGVIHANTAARKVARLTKRINSVLDVGASSEEKA